MAGWSLGAPAGITGAMFRSPPARAADGFRPERVAAWVRRVALPLAVLGTLALLWVLELTRVPQGMDTVPDIAPGSTLLLDRRWSSAREGIVVMVDLPQGGTLLTRLARVEPDGRLWVENDRKESLLPDSRALGALAPDCYRGAVLVVFPPDTGIEVPR